MSLIYILKIQNLINRMSFWFSSKKNEIYKDLRKKTSEASFKISLKNFCFLLAGLKKPCIFAAAYEDNGSYELSGSSLKTWIWGEFQKLFGG